MIKRTIGEQIKIRLDELGKDQYWLAKSINVSQPAVSKWINGKSFPSKSYWEPLCAELGLEMKWFFDEECEIEECEEPVSVVQDSDVQEIHAQATEKVEAPNPLTVNVTNQFFNDNSTQNYLSKTIVMTKEASHNDGMTIYMLSISFIMMAFGSFAQTADKHVLSVCLYTVSILMVLNAVRYAVRHNNTEKWLAHKMGIGLACVFMFTVFGLMNNVLFLPFAFAGLVLIVDAFINSSAHDIGAVCSFFASKISKHLS